ncbi:MFS general substrate transporter [Daldinia loculata]|uniref:MFS general substrate transporter n=1 Tax=Daldinia loculata TaxID=103429 RepID=UPI0020C32CAC|nr:MFS general substrate transporter [Daldinia loculata]KAI1646371.1 MFS general substrate transporter [Daldinia loculata]KAI2785148.1 MFS general substrate transporter [Daldinia loculata]
MVTIAPPMQEREDVEILKDNPPFKPDRNFILAFISICIITLAAALDATSLSIALPIITEDLKGSGIEAFWTGTSFLLTSAVFQPVIAGLSHVFGRKNLLIISSFLFVVGAIICAVARNFTVMLTGRSIQGIGGGGILALGEIIVTDLVPLVARGTWFGYLGSTWALGSVAGPLLGAVFAESVTWQWIFWINLPIVGVGMVLLIPFLKLESTPGKLSTKLRLFDWIGSIIFVAGTVGFLIPVTWGGVMYPWDHWRTIVPLLIGFDGIIAFAIYEWWLSRRAFDAEGNSLPGEHIEPIVRFTIFNNYTMLITFLSTVLHGVVVWSLLYFLPLYYEAVKEYSPIISGVAILPETGLVAPVSVIAAVLCTRFGKYRWALWSGWVCTTAGSGLLFILSPDTSVPGWIFLNFLVSIGTGILFPAMSLGTQAASRPQDSGHTAGFFSFLRVFGQAIGVAVSGVAFQNQLQSELQNYEEFAPVAAQYSRDATAIVGIIKALPDGTTKTDLKQAYSDSLHVIWLLMTVVSGVALLTSFTTKEYSLEQEHDTRQKFNGGKNKESMTDLMLR